MRTRTAVGIAGSAGAGCLGLLGGVALLGWRLASPAPPWPAPSAPAETRGPSEAGSAVAWRFAAEISAADRAALAEAGAADVRHVEQSFEQRFAAPPEVIVRAGEASFAESLADVFGLDRARAASLARMYAGYTGRRAGGRREVTVIDWSRMAKERPIFRLRHELSHVMIHQRAAGSPNLPSWLDEGLAELEAQSVPGLSWTALQSRYFAASMAATDTLVPLPRLTTYEQTLASLADQIANATESVRLLEADATRAGVLRILDHLARGETFEASFRAATGAPFARFAEQAGPRLRALAPSYPGIATAPDDPSGPGLTYVLYGFKPGSAVTVTLHGQGLQSSHTCTMSAHGFYAGYFTPAWPDGAYDIQATGAEGSARVTAMKASAHTAPAVSGGSRDR